jgi:hypothetical protein
MRNAYKILIGISKIDLKETGHEKCILDSSGSE